jgi:hypothetical protein
MVDFCMNKDLMGPSGLLISILEEREKWRLDLLHICCSSHTSINANGP